MTARGTLLPVRLTEWELSKRSGTTTERIRRFVELRILEPEEGAFRPADIQRVRVTEALDKAGIPPEHLGRIVEEGYYSFAWGDLLFPDPTPLSDRSLEETAADLGIPMSLVERAFTLWSVAIPAPGDLVRQDDAEMLGVVAEAYRVLGGDENRTAAGLRYFGENLRRIAESQMRWFRSHVEEPFLASGAPQPEIAPVVTETASRLLPLAHRAVVLGYRRHLEHYTVEDVIQNVEVALERAGLTSPGRRHPGIGFVDLTGYTGLTEEHGDAAAADLADRLADVVRETVGERGGRAVKFLGDGAMFHFAQPIDSVRCGLDLVERIPSRGLPKAHVGVNAGPVVFRDGDYFGRTVNAAARIADYARPGEVLVAEEVLAGSRPSDVRFEPLGPVSLKGLSAPVVLLRAARA